MITKHDGFLDKFLKRLDKIDRTSLENYVRKISNEKDFAYTILNECPEGILIINTQGIVTFSNNAAQDILVRSQAEVMPSLQTVFEDKVLYDFIRKHFEQSQRVVHKRMEVLKPKQMCLRISLIPLYDHKGRGSIGPDMIAYIVIIHDLCIEDELALSQQQDTIESITKLAAGIAHEIGNPLNTINIYLQLINQSIKSGKIDDISQWIKIVSSETKRLDKIVKNFLNMTRSKIGFFKEGNINKCIENATHFLMPEIKHRNITIDMKLDTQIPIFFINAEKLYEAFLNIIKNSIEAMPDGGVLEIKSTLKGNLVSIICKDTGVGIDEEDLPHIFDAYYTSKEEGSGLGLMNVYNIVKTHRGRVHVESKPGHGTVVMVMIPLRREKLQLTHAASFKQSNSS
ncbi:MAG: PAS domain-containing protein [Candidatus Omnitrophica bacterium]|nr:PAS domain-containing protein [Candidatus Omnitrophota bacterium]